MKTGFGCQVSGFRYLVSGFRFQVSRSAVFFALLLVFTLHAEFFWRVPNKADTLLHMNGTRVYATEVLLNDMPGTLTAYAFGSSAAETAATLALRLGLPLSATFGATLLTHVEKNTMRRFFVLPSPSGQEACVVLAFDQTLRDFACARQKPPAWPESLPAINAAPIFSAVCRLTRTAFVTADSPATPEAAVEEAAQTLRSAGWSETTPATTTFKLFTSGKKQCALFASRNPKTGQTTISLLQREGATP